MFFSAVDRGIEFQQNLQSRHISVLLVRAQSSRLADLLPHVPEILKRLESSRPGEIVSVG